MGGKELKTRVENPFEDSSGKVKQREIWNLGNVFFFFLPWQILQHACKLLEMIQ